jgi:hypothetical protein
MKGISHSEEIHHPVAPKQPDDGGGEQMKYYLVAIWYCKVLANFLKEGPFNRNRPLNILIKNSFVGYPILCGASCRESSGAMHS